MNECSKQHVTVKLIVKDSKGKLYVTDVIKQYSDSHLCSLLEVYFQEANRKEYDNEDGCADPYTEPHLANKG